MNVILVDFRAFDTFGEIAVLGIVGLTVLRSCVVSVLPLTQPDRQPSRKSRTPMTRQRLTARQVKHWPIIWPCRPSSCNGCSRLSLCWQCICSCAVMICQVADLRPVLRSQLHFCCNIWRQARVVEDRLRILPLRWIGLGLLFAAATGAGSWFFGYPFLTTFFQYTEIPHIGKMPTASALLFDLGVFTLVVGATVLVLIALAHQSLRKHRVEKLAATKEEN